MFLYIPIGSQYCVHKTKNFLLLSGMDPCPALFLTAPYSYIPSFPNVYWACHASRVATWHFSHAIQDQWKSPAAPWSVLQHQSRRVVPAPLATEIIWVFFWVHSCTRLEARIRISSFWVQWSQDIKSRTQKTGRGLFQTYVPNPNCSLWMTLCSPSRCRCRTQVFCVKDGFHLNRFWPPQQANGLPYLWYWLTPFCPQYGYTSLAFHLQILTCMDVCIR